jgi:peroxiredoxin
LAGLQRHAEAFADADVRVLALSADDEEGARAMKDDEDLTFPVLYGLDVDDIQHRFGLYIEKGERTYLQPAQLIVDPDGRVTFASYSSGPVGRLDAEEALTQIPTAAS